LPNSKKMKKVGFFKDFEGKIGPIIQNFTQF